MIDVTFAPLHGQTEVAIAGLIFAAGETKSFGTGADSLTDDDAAFILRNPNFIDASLGRNPNFTCACGKPIAAFVQTRDGFARSDATSCGSCDAPNDDAPGEMPAELAAALAEPHGTPALSEPEPHHDLASDDAEPHLHDDN